MKILIAEDKAQIMYPLAQYLVNKGMAPSYPIDVVSAEMAEGIAKGWGFGENEIDYSKEKAFLAATKNAPCIFTQGDVSVVLATGCGAAELAITDMVFDVCFFDHRLDGDSDKIVWKAVAQPHQPKIILISSDIEWQMKCLKFGHAESAELDAMVATGRIVLGKKETIVHDMELALCAPKPAKPTVAKPRRTRKP